MESGQDERGEQAASVVDAMLLLDLPRHRATTKEELNNSYPIPIPKEQTNRSQIRLVIQNSPEEEELYLAAHALLSRSPVQYSPVNNKSPVKASSDRTSTRRATRVRSESLVSPTEISPKKAKRKEKVEKKPFAVPADGIRKCSFCSATQTPMWRHGMLNLT